jgi:hypothetical protein
VYVFSDANEDKDVATCTLSKSCTHDFVNSTLKLLDAGKAPNRGLHEMYTSPCCLTLS